MKTTVRIMMMIACLVLATSCTEQYMARHYGGKMKIELPKGERLINATWNESDLCYLTEPMDSGYVPKEKVFRESSSLGVFESEIIFMESR